MSFYTASPFSRRANRVCAAIARIGASASLLAVIALSACAGGDSKTPTETVVPPVTPPVTPDPVPPVATGIAAVAATGLPIGVSSRVTVRSGTVSHVLVGSSSVAGLTVGNWIATAEIVTADGIAYAPTPVTQTITITESNTTTINVGYLPNSGAMKIALTGLPPDGVGLVQITGPGAYSRTIGNSLSIIALVPGKYHLEALGVRLTTGAFAPTVAQQDIDIAASITPVDVAVAYVAAPSIVNVFVSGLLGGSSAVITLTPPSGSPIAVTGSARLPAALAGRWQMGAAVVHFSGYTWAPTPAAKDTSVIAGDSLAFNVQYALTTGAMAVVVGGLPAGVNGSVKVTGPGGFQRALTATSTITDLTPGGYTVTADSLVNSGTTYRVVTGSQPVTVVASLTATGATVTYSSAIATLIVGVTGVPIGATNMIEVTGPAGFDRFINGTTTFANVAPGIYNINANSIILPGGIRYDGTPAQSQRTLNFGLTDSVGVAYARPGGRLAMTVSGLPNGVSANISLNGGTSPIAITGTSTLDNVVPGSYTLVASSVIAGASTYTPTPLSTPIVISLGSTTPASITYSVVPVGSGLNLIMDGFYLTQAVQTLSGNVPLVAGRDALLRVFVHASTTNSVQPDVRVRIYDGTTLLQTLTLPAPETSVRTSLAEGTLTSTWNSLIPAINVRTSMRVVAEVDPGSAIVESDETDNTWPRSGTPQSITVNAVPTFNVRFVPVTVGGLTGAVSNANKDQFLVSTRRMHPISDVVSDVRAPFTSSATSLQSGDANGAWTTVLSEMNALRSADGAPTALHYFGVVKVTYNSGVAGYGYVPGRAAVGWDYLPSADAMAVHEWGHNFSRPHTNCGGADNPDPAYPYLNGTIGVYGWNPGTGAIVLPTATDVMGYCSNQWTSDWTWTKVMNYRATSGFMAAASVVGAKQDGLLVWGRIVNGKVMLEPSFRVHTYPTPVPPTGTHRLQALDSRGTAIIDIPLTPESVDHAFDRDERHFAVVLPWSAKLERALTTVRVVDSRQPTATGSSSSAAMRVAASASPAIDSVPVVMPDAGAQLTAVAGARTRVQWNTAAYPMVMARDASTGEIMAFLRNSGDVFVTQGRKVELVFSDGVRSRVERQ